MNIEKTLYNIKRYQIIETKLNAPTANLIPDEYVYAWYRNIYPYGMESQDAEALADQFETCYNLMDRIIGFADDNALQSKYYTFYQYEDIFMRSQQTKIDIERSQLISIFRYMKLRDSWDERFWNELLRATEYPSEASSIIRPLSLSELYLY